MTSRPRPTGDGRPPRKRTPRIGEVVRSARTTPHMIRVVLGGEGLSGLRVGEFADHYVKLLVPPRRRQLLGALRRRAGLRRHLRAERGLDAAWASVSGYWRRGDTEDGWQSTEREWNAAIEAEDAGPAR